MKTLTLLASFLAKLSTKNQQSLMWYFLVYGFPLNSENGHYHFMNKIKAMHSKGISVFQDDFCKYQRKKFRTNASTKIIKNIILVCKKEIKYSINIFKVYKVNVGEFFKTWLIYNYNYYNLVYDN